MVSNTAHCKGFGAETLFCFAFFEVLRRQDIERTEMYSLYSYFNNAQLSSWVSQISVSSQIHFTDINLVVMHNWRKNTTQCLQTNGLVVAMVPHLNTSMTFSLVKCAHIYI